MEKLLTILGILLIFVVSLYSLACDSGNQASTQQHPTLNSGLDLSSSEPSTPIDFVTYTDDTGAFSISYPEDWELVPSMINSEFAKIVAKALVKDIIDSIDEGSLKGVNCIFFAGVHCESGYNPNVNINVNPIPNRVSTNDSYSLSKAAFEAMEEKAAGLQLLSVDKGSVDGHVVAIIDFKITHPVTGTNRYITTQIIEGGGIWTVTCSSEAIDFPKYKDNFYAIVRSLRIHK